MIANNAIASALDTAKVLATRLCSASTSKEVVRIEMNIARVERVLVTTSEPSFTATLH